MPNFQVLRCASDECRIYQVLQQKKSPKWVCKVYFESTNAKDCREAVQSLNLRHHMRDNARDKLAVRLMDNPKAPSVPTSSGADGANSTADSEPRATRWQEFVEEESSDDGEHSEAMQGLSKPGADPNTSGPPLTDV
ncbi:hypothetical protein EV182_007843, partial [Spiromyces aspiralis]